MQKKILEAQGIERKFQLLTLAKETQYRILVLLSSLCFKHHHFLQEHNMKYQGISRENEIVVPSMWACVKAGHHGTEQSCSPHGSQRTKKETETMGLETRYTLHRLSPTHPLPPIRSHLLILHSAMNSLTD
jgi:hypothetical protein